MLAPDPFVIMANDGDVDEEKIKNLRDTMLTVLPQKKIRVCILGGKDFKSAVTRPLIEAIAQQLRVFSGKIVVLTGGLEGVQKLFANSVGNDVTVYNFLPGEQSSGYDVGEDVPCGSSLKERMAVFGRLGDIYLSFEGGPGVGAEATAAFDRGAVVLALRGTGGASAGKLGFPTGALERPDWAARADWEMLGGTEPSKVALAVARLIFARICANDYADESIDQGGCCGNDFLAPIANFIGRRVQQK